MLASSLQYQFERCKPWLEAALEYNGGYQTLDDVWAGVSTGVFILVPGYKCAIVLEPNLVRKKVMNFFLAGGDLEELKELESKIARRCKEEGFDSMTIVGRRGWVKRLDGYKETAVVLEKQL